MSDERLYDLYYSAEQAESLSHQLKGVSSRVELEDGTVVHYTEAIRAGKPPTSGWEDLRLVAQGVSL